jgi:hypothetical protein
LYAATRNNRASRNFCFVCPVVIYEGLGGQLSEIIGRAPDRITDEVGELSV